MRIRDGKNSDPVSRREKFGSRIRDKHPGSATLLADANNSNFGRTSNVREVISQRRRFVCGRFTQFDYDVVVGYDVVFVGYDVVVVGDDVVVLVMMLLLLIMMLFCWL